VTSLPVPDPSWWSVIVLTGGTSSRMGRDKATLVLDGMTLLDRTLHGVPDDVRVVVAGPTTTVGRSVSFVREQPPGGGPVAGLDAALAVIEASAVVVLATDLPLVADLPSQLAAALHAADGSIDAVVAVDADGRLQHLCAAYRTARLRDAIAAGGTVSGASMRSVVARLQVQRLVTTGAAADVDTPADLDAARAALSRAPYPPGAREGG
jgi:molybdopterin-guanine dinucleotide biosynthesis protein A